MDFKHNIICNLNEIYKCYVRSILEYVRSIIEYVSIVWSLHHMHFIDLIENV